MLAAIDQQVTAGTADATRQGLSGHSAGGLAAFSASAVRTVKGTLLFDPTDQNNIGATAAPTVPGPTLWLFAEPATCNVQGNADAWFAPKPGLKGRLKVVNAGHCDPQDPVASLCSGACGGGYSATRSALYRTYAVSFFQRFLLNQPTPCLEDLAATDLAAGRVTAVDLQLGACGVDAGTGGGAGGGTGGGAGGGTGGGGGGDAGVDDAGVDAGAGGGTGGGAGGGTGGGTGGGAGGGTGGGTGGGAGGGSGGGAGDGGAVDDAGTGAGTGGGDPMADGGMEPQTPAGGCGCTATPGPLLGVLLLAWLARRRGRGDVHRSAPLARR